MIDPVFIAYLPAFCVLLAAGVAVGILLGLELGKKRRYALAETCSEQMRTIARMSQQMTFDAEWLNTLRAKLEATEAQLEDSKTLCDFWRKAAPLKTTPDQSYLNAPKS